MPLTHLIVEQIRGLRRDASAAPASRFIRLADKASRSGVPVLIEGEAGTGGDALARAIHECGERRSKPFVRLHAGGRAEELCAELFGIEAGSHCRHPGKFGEAHGGTLLVQGVEELSMDLQGRLLRALQDGEIEPVGARRSQRIDVRVIATTHADLIERVRQGLFREDLYYRLHVLPIGLPPLRLRRDEIPDLALALAARFAADEGKRLAGLSPEAGALLQRYDWPGNLRQLENAVFRAVALAEGDRLTVAEFPQIAARLEGVAVEIPPLPASVAGLVAHPEERSEIRDPHALSLVDEEGEMRRLGDLEASIIRFALSHYRGHMSAVSRRLGIGRSTLYRKLKDLGLDQEAAEPDPGAAPAGGAAPYETRRENRRAG
jgi:DNA-binding NtrC family response regulator